MTFWHILGYSLPTVKGESISEDLTWSINSTTLITAAQQMLYYMRMPNKTNPSSKLRMGYCHEVALTAQILPETEGPACICEKDCFWQSNAIICSLWQFLRIHHEIWAFKLISVQLASPAPSKSHPFLRLLLSCMGPHPHQVEGVEASCHFWMSENMSRLWYDVVVRNRINLFYLPPGCRFSLLTCNCVFSSFRCFKNAQHSSLARSFVSSHLSSVKCTCSSSWSSHTRSSTLIHDSAWTSSLFQSLLGATRDVIIHKVPPALSESHQEYDQTKDN